MTLLLALTDQAEDVSTYYSGIDKKLTKIFYKDRSESSLRLTFDDFPNILSKLEERRKMIVSLKLPKVAIKTYYYAKSQSHEIK